MHISYMRRWIESFPDIRCSVWRHRNTTREVVSLFNGGKRTHRHFTDTDEGRRLLKVKQIRDNNLRILSLLEKDWQRDYSEPCKTIYVPDFGETANKIFFDSLVERSNSYKPSKNKKSPPPVFYDGKPFKSKFEADFARLMDEYGIPYKYEARISTVRRKTRCPDFFLYLPWLDLLILVEIYGACSKKDYLPTIDERQHEYLSCEWMPGTNMLSFYYSDETAYIPEMVIEEIESVECRRLRFLENEGMTWKRAG